MPLFRISGVWKDFQNVITHYAFHTVSIHSVLTATKKTKAEAIGLLETEGNDATTWI